MSQKTDGLYYLNNHFNSAIVAYDEVSENESLDINRKQESVEVVVLAFCFLLYNSVSFIIVLLVISVDHMFIMWSANV